MQTFSDRLNYLAESTGKRKTEIAKMLSVSDAAVWKLCNGKSNPSKQTIVMISERFGVSEKWLLTGEGEMQLHAEPELSGITRQLIQIGEESERYQAAVSAVRYVMQLDEARAKLFGQMIETLKEMNAIK